MTRIDGTMRAATEPGDKLGARGYGVRTGHNRDVQLWPVRTLREANVALIDCDHRTPPAQEEGYPYVTIPQLKNGRIELLNARRISHEHYFEWTRKAKPSAYDVVLSRRCNPGETAFVPPDVEFALGQNLVLLRADGSEVYPPFLRWLVRSPDWWDQIKTFINVGAVFESLRCADIPNFSLCIPPMREQKLIAGFLGVLDEKIELLQKESLSLEQVARTIFKSWFVDFDPVRAKAEGREPNGMDAATAAIFPNEFHDSLVDPLPMGWERMSLGEISQVGIGKTPPRAQSQWFSESDDDVVWVSIRDMGKSGAYINSSSEFLTREAIDRFNVRLVPDNTVIISFKLTVGRIAITDGQLTTNEAIAHCVLPNDARVSSEYLYCALAAFDFTSLASTSSIAEAVNSKTIRALSITVPKKPLMDAYTGIAQPLFQIMKNNQRTIDTLS